jgi:3-deoxy-7-phosphoheptulonate synthase
VAFHDPQLKSTRKPELGTRVVSAADMRFGDGSFPVLAGPGAVESQEQIVAAASAISDAGGLVIRSATFLPPDVARDFVPLGREGLLLLEHAAKGAGIASSTFVFDAAEAMVAATHVDLLEVGPSRMGDAALLAAVGSVGKPVIVHRGSDATIDGWLAAASTVANGGADVILCERGSQGHDPRTSGTLDISAVAVVQQLADHPVVVNPAPIVGSLDLIRPLALAARVAGADGLMVAVHPDPDGALFRTGGHLNAEAFAALMEALGIPSLRDEIDRIDRELLKLVARRLRNSVEIGLIKHSRGEPMHSPEREAELIEEVRADATDAGLDPAYMEAIMRVVLDHSKTAQSAAIAMTPLDGEDGA